MEHDDVIKWKHFPCDWPFVRGIHRSPVNSSHKGQWRRALMFTLICAKMKGWVNNREGDDLRRNRAHYDVTVMNLFWFRLSTVFDLYHCHALCILSQILLKSGFTHVLIFTDLICVFGNEKKTAVLKFLYCIFHQYINSSTWGYH